MGFGKNSNKFIYGLFNKIIFNLSISYNLSIINKISKNDSTFLIE